MFGFHADVSLPVADWALLGARLPTWMSSSILRNHYSLMFDGISYHHSAHDLYAEKLYDVTA
jgi:hypothetical protein